MGEVEAMVEAPVQCPQSARFRLAGWLAHVVRDFPAPTGRFISLRIICLCRVSREGCIFILKGGHHPGPRCFGADGAMQVTSTIARRSTLGWIDAWNLHKHGPSLMLVAPKNEEPTLLPHSVRHLRGTISKTSAAKDRLLYGLDQYTDFCV